MELVSRLELVRREAAAPIKITNGYRCAAYQQSLRSAVNNDGSPRYKTSKKQSQHELGKAADFISNGRVHLQHVEPFFRAIGDAITWFHVDLRDDRQRRWTY